MAKLLADVFHISTGVGVVTVGHLERGIKCCERNTVKRLAQVLHIAPETLAPLVHVGPRPRPGRPPGSRRIRIDPDDDPELLEAEAAIAADEAALQRRGYPRPDYCLRCDTPIKVERPSERLCPPCRGDNAETHDTGAVPPYWLRHVHDHRPKAE